MTPERIAELRSWATDGDPALAEALDEIERLARQLKILGDNYRALLRSSEERFRAVVARSRRRRAGARGGARRSRA